MAKRKGQIWIETVVYTLIGLALIGIILAIITPKINDSRDKIIVEQATSAMNDFGEKIREVLDRPVGNKRVIDEFLMKRGEFQIDGVNDQVVFLLDGLGNPYSEPGVPVESGWVTILTEQGQKDYAVRLSLDYNSTTNITYRGEDVLKQFGPTSIPYSFSIEGLNGVVNVEEISR